MPDEKEFGGNSTGIAHLIGDAIERGEFSCIISVHNGFDVLKFYQELSQLYEPFEFHIEFKEGDGFQEKHRVEWTWKKKPQIGEKISFHSTYLVKKAGNPNQICDDCAFDISPFHCLKRSACPDDGTGLNYYMENIKVIE